MPDIAALIQSGSSNLWLFFPSAVLLGALHGLEPGHSKTMMAAFIIAVRGTVMQAVLLGLTAAISHTAVVWAVALVGLHYAAQLNSERTEGYFQLVSAILIIAIALWMLWRTWRTQRPAVPKGRHHADGHEQHHGHEHQHGHDHDEKGEPMDAHSRAHAEDIEKRFANRQVTTGQIVLFGLTGGLIPCPAAITVLLLCLQLKQFSMGAALVAGFSIGLAITMVSVGAVAALSIHHVSRRWPGFGTLARTAPFVSSLLILCVGFYTGYLGLNQVLGAS